MNRAVLALVILLVAALTAIGVALALKHSNAKGYPNLPPYGVPTLRPCTDTGNRFTKLQLINQLATAPRGRSSSGGSRTA